MSLNDLANPEVFDDCSEEDEDVYIPVAFRFHDLAQRDEYKLLLEEIEKNNKREYNPHDVVLSLDQEDNYGFTPLHIAIMRGNIETIRVCIDNGVKLSLEAERIPYSIFLLYIYASTSMYRDSIIEVLKLLLLPESVHTMIDRQGRTIAHIAATYNIINVMEYAIQELPSIVEMVDHDGNSVLHAACKYSDNVDMVSLIMDSAPQIARIVNKFKQNALHVCISNNSLECYQALIRCRCSDLDIHEEDIFGNCPIDCWKHVMDEKREHSCSGFPHDTSKTLVIVPEPYDDHKTCAYPPSRSECLPAEHVQRLHVLMSPEVGGSLLVSPLQDRIVIEKEMKQVEMSNLLRVHDVNYMMKIINTCNQEPATDLNKVDIDTTVSSNSFIQARRAAQAVCTAVDHLYDSSVHGEGYRNAFCCVRPPGHHIGTNGPVNNENNSAVSQGFCLFNNVAIAAAYARATYSSFKRIAIIDLDIHHGNGTEDCIQHICPCKQTITTQINNMEMKFTSYQYKPWLNETDGENVFFASLHGYGRLGNSNDFFFPGSGRAENKVNYVSKSESGIDFTKPEIVDVYLSKQQGNTAYFWREHLRRNILPKLFVFKPDLIFISAGFDGHSLELLNNGFGGLSESDFAYATSEIMKVANATCAGRVISVLEGGYDVLGGCTSPLAQSVLAHVEALTGHFYDSCSPSEWNILGEIEKKEYDEMAAVKNIPVVSLMAPVEKNEEEEMEEGSFDFDAMSDDDGEHDEHDEKPVVIVKVDNKINEKSVEKHDLPVVDMMEEESLEGDDDDGSEDIEGYEMPDIEEGEVDKIVDPFAEKDAPTEEDGGRRKRTRAKIDYVALEAQLRKEEEMHKKVKL